MGNGDSERPEKCPVDIFGWKLRCSFSELGPRQAQEQGTGLAVAV